MTLSRQDAARWLGELAKALGEGGTADVALVGPGASLNLPDEFECELEPYGDKIELEIEFTWPNSRSEPSNPPRSTVAAPDPGR